MSIEYYLTENKLSTEDDVFRAVVQPKHTVDLDEIITQVVRRGSTLMREDVMAALEAYHDTILHLLEEGNNVVTPTANYRISIKGVFNGAGDSFDGTRHKMEVRLNPGVLLRDTQLSVKKMEGSIPRPNLLTFQDPANGGGGFTAVSGGGGKIKGHRLKFDQADPEQGVFFIAAGGAEVRVTQVLNNRPGEIIMIVPALTAGQYRLEVRSLFGKQLRRGSLERPVTVA
jgi:hypothetical protein